MSTLASLKASLVATLDRELQDTGNGKFETALAESIDLYTTQKIAAYDVAAINPIRQQIAALDTRVAAIEALVANIQAQFATIQQQVDSLPGSISAQIATAQSQLSSQITAAQISSTTTVPTTTTTATSTQAPTTGGPPLPDQDFAREVPTSQIIAPLVLDPLKIGKFDLPDDLKVKPIEGDL